MHDVFVGRQPIYDRQLEVFAYELLFRSGEVNAAGFVDGEHATSQVILNTFTEIGLNNIVGGRSAFLNLTKDFILSGDLSNLPSEQVVLEVLENVEVDNEVVEAIRQLKKQNYTIALDDFEFDESWRPLVELADIVKLDVMALSAEQIKKHVDFLRPYKLKLLAEKVETHEEYHAFRGMGFDYFQGYFFCKPNVVKGHRTPANRLATLRLIAALQSPDATLQELDKIIGQDLTLSYKMLKYINSAFFGLPRKVESIRQAIIFLGRNKIKNWATLMALSNIDDKPYELIVTSLVRARMCELLANKTRLSQPESAFTIGMFSSLDALMDMPLDQVMQTLPLSDEIQSALLHKSGMLGRILSCALAYEQGDWERVDLENLEEGAIMDAYLSAISWSTEVSSIMAKNA